MIAFDTNLLVRALVDDHPEQVAVVRQLIASDRIFISRTVFIVPTLRVGTQPWTLKRPSPNIYLHQPRQAFIVGCTGITPMLR
jgi:predicted nucleic-acid-binding protein